MLVHYLPHAQIQYQFVVANYFIINIIDGKLNWNGNGFCAHFTYLGKIIEINDLEMKVGRTYSLFELSLMQVVESQPQDGTGAFGLYMAVQF